MAKKTQQPKVVTRFKGHDRKPTFIRAWRKHRGLTLEQLSERTDMTPGNLSEIERGQTAYTQTTLEGLAYALSCEPADLLMRNPLDTEAPWSIWDALKPDQRRQAIRLLKALVDEKAA